MKHGKPLVLLVEDNADDRELAMLAFDEAGLRNKVAACEDEPQALALLREWESDALGRPHAPGLILLDIKLTGGDGFHLLQTLRAMPSLRHVPVVMLSSSSESADIARSYELGANSYLRKPVDFESFVAVARTLGHYWLQLNEPPPSLA